MNKRLFSVFMFLAALFAPVYADGEEVDAPIKVAAAADEGNEDADAMNLLKPTNDLESWQLELNDGGQGKMEVDEEAIVFHVLSTTGTNWHVQAYQTEIDLKEGQDYVVKFQLKADDSVEVLLLGCINEDDWHEIGLHESIIPGSEYRDYEFAFTATDVAEKNNRVGFVLGESKGVVSVKNMTLTEE